MKKRIISAILIFILVLGSGMAVFADDDAAMLGADSKGQQTTYQFNEFARLKTLKTLVGDSKVDSMSDSFNGVEQSKLTSADLDTMESQLRSELSRRTKLSDAVLSKMGYSESDIAVLRTLTGDEPLTTLAQTNALLASVTCKRSLDLYQYKTAVKKTYFSVNLSYEWDKIPMLLYTDIVGIGWNNKYAILSQTGYNVLNTTYVNALTGETSVKKYKFVETGLCTSSVNITMDTGSIQSGIAVWAKSGYAHIQLCAAGKMTNSKFDFKYGHKGIKLGSPSISAPWGIGFTLENVTDTYAPSNGVLNAQTPTII